MAYKPGNTTRVRFSEDNCGWFTITPLSAGMRQWLKDNSWFGYDEAFIQDEDQRMQFLIDHPQARFRHPASPYGDTVKIGRYSYAVNDGARFMMDTEELFNLIGGVM